jgi:hypothetical protein
MDRGIRTTRNLAEKERKELWGMRGENTRDRDRGREPGRNSGNTRSSEQRRRRVTFILDFR